MKTMCSEYFVLKHVILFAVILCAPDFENNVAAKEANKHTDLEYFFRLMTEKKTGSSVLVTSGIDRLGNAKFLVINYGDGERLHLPLCPVITVKDKSFIEYATIGAEEISTSRKWWILRNDVYVACGSLSINKAELTELINDIDISKCMLSLAGLK